LTGQEASHAVELRGMVKRFGRFTAVDGLDLLVRPGSVHGFLGPNGAGKSVTVRVLLGLHRSDAGLVRVLGLDPGHDPAGVTRCVSYVPGDAALWPLLTGQEVLDALAGLRGRYDVAAERRLVDAFALDPRKRVRTYSRGNRQKVLLVAAFAARTDLLVLDEPTSGLDPLMEEVFQRCVRDAAADGRTVLLSSHILSEVERLCTDVTILKDGRLVEAGALADLRHLAASTITGRVHASAADLLREALGAVTGPGTDLTVDAQGAVDVRVAAAEVPAVLRCLLDHRAAEITCAPATLDDLFLRHYKVAAR
jgi:ABC-2 type transport system ATP-binding protein